MALTPLGFGPLTPPVEVPPPPSLAEEPSAAAPSAPPPFPVEELLQVVDAWIKDSMDTAPPASQLHFSIHLLEQMDDLRERLGGFA